MKGNLPMRITLQPIRGALPLLLALSLSLPIGCATSHARLPQRIDAAGVPHSFKRVERFAQRDFLHHFIRVAYYRTNPDSFMPVADSDQATVVKQWGPPTWIRKPFDSLQSERVKEWLYIDQRRIFQFIGGQLVYDGPLSDYEQTLLSRGYPDRVEVGYADTGTNIDIFVYTRIFTPMLEQFYFVNGTLIQSKEGN
jgi:hypothetical protein